MEALGQLLRRARQRVAANLIIEQASFGLTLGLACGVLLLILGTQILNWYWPVVLFLGAFGIGLARFWNQLPGDYRIAQILDTRLSLPDTLSTAWHFRDDAKADAGMLELQRRSAETAALQADVATALPYRSGRMTMAALAALGVFSALMLYRYGSQSRLDLSQPLVPGLVDLFGQATQGPLASNLAKKKFDPAQPENFEGTSSSQDDRKQEESQALDEAPEDVLKTIGVPEVDNSAAEPVKGEGPQKDSDNQGTDDGAGDEGEKSAAGESGKNSESASKDGGNNPEKSDSKNAQQQQGGENNSLMDKFRDAMANMMNKLKQPGKQGGDQMAKNQKQEGQGQGKGEGGKQAEKGQPQSGKPNAEGGDGEQKGDSDSEGGDQQQSAKGKGSSDSNQPKGGDDPKSGMGSQDGAKDVRLAEQMQAMGKLSEIIGKRSEKQTGEMMVEVSSGKNQQLKTAYSTKTGQHADTGGEIHRDEVPLVYQQYVQSYFEQIRRSAPAAAPAKPAAANPPATPRP